MVTYAINDPLGEPTIGTVEVTVEVGGGRRRWCFFATPQALAAFGYGADAAGGWQDLRATPMIVVGELNESAIARVLRQLYERGELEAHTLPVH